MLCNNCLWAGVRYVGYAYVEYACVAKPPFTLKPIVKPKSLTILWSSTLGAVAAYGWNPVTTWPKGNNWGSQKAAYKWNNNLIQTQPHAQIYDWHHKGWRNYKVSKIYASILCWKYGHSKRQRTTSIQEARHLRVSSGNRKEEVKHTIRVTENLCTGCEN